MRITDDFLYKTLESEAVKRYLSSRGLEDRLIAVGTEFCMQMHEAWKHGDSDKLDAVHTALATNDLTGFASHATADQLACAKQLVKFANAVLPIGMRESPAAFIDSYSQNF